MNKILLTVIFTSLLLIGNSISNISMYESFIPTLNPLQIFKDPSGNSNLLENELSREQPISATIVIKKEDDKKLDAYLNRTYIERYSNIDLSLIENSYSSSSHSSFSANIIGQSSQPICFVSYTNSAKYHESGEWKNIGDDNPANHPIFIISGLHEVEHCLMPKWAINQAQKEIYNHNKISEESISEAMADIIALSLIKDNTRDHEIEKSLIDYRKLTNKDWIGKNYKNNLFMIETYLKDKITVDNTLPGRIVFLRKFITKTKTDWK